MSSLINDNVRTWFYGVVFTVGVGAIWLAAWCNALAADGLPHDYNLPGVVSPTMLRHAHATPATQVCGAGGGGDSNP